MKKFVLSIFTIFVLAVSSFAEGKIAYIDVQKVFTQSKAGIDLKAKLQSIANKAKSEIQSKAATINQKDQVAMQKLQQEIIQKQQELQKIQQQSVEKFADFVRKSVNEFANKNGYELVVDSQAVLYGKKKYDKTEDFIKYLDNKYQKEKPEFIK